MSKVYIVGNPNSGKTTLFNSITKSSEHTGNWHGVTVDKTSKIIKFNNNEYELIDLPGIYSLNAFSLEEQVSIDEINTGDDKILYLIDAFNFRRSMLLALDLLIKNKNIKILINNYTKFQKSGGTIDIDYLHKVLGCDIEIINARKIKVDENFFNFTTNKTAFAKTITNQIQDLNQFTKTQILYNYISKISQNCVKTKDNIYGYHKADNILLKLGVFLPLFIILMFGAIYITFFLLGPILCETLLKGLNLVIQKPIIAILTRATKSDFIIKLFSEGIFGACFSILGFLPQITLMYIFLSGLENSGIISRMAFLFDDLLQKVGLNGKMVYTMLMGFGCSTTATISAKNMSDKNSQIKASLLTPFMSCSAKLPIYTVVASALFGINSIWIVFGLYLLGIIVAIILAIIFDRTILKSDKAQFIIEFPPLRKPQIFEIWQSVKSSCKQFVTKIFSVIFGASVILWLLSNVNIKFQFVGDSTRSILYSFSSIIAWAFKPIGLNNPNIICALLVGLVAKELILSNFAISNKITSLTALGASLTITSSAVNFNIASGISFLIFTLLYFPCVSNFGVMLKQIGTKFTLIGVALQLGIAYLISYFAYSILTQNITNFLIVLVVIIIIIVSIKTIFNKIKSKKIFCNCINCNKCKNK